MQYKMVKLGDDPWSEDLKHEIISSPHYKTAKQWIRNINIPIEETEYFKWLESQLEINGSVWNGLLSTRKDIIRQYNNFKHLFEIAPNFREEEPTTQVINGVSYYYGPICVKIRCNGEIRVWDGMHRISILLATHQPIKFTICEREDGWKNLLNDLKVLYPGMMYQAIPHPDIIDWPCCSYDLKEQQIADVVKVRSIRSVLDLGSCHGHVLYSLKDLLQSAAGVEYNPIRYRVLKMLFDKLGFEAYNANIFDIASKTTKHFDCVFALAVFHHFAKENPIEKLEALLDQIKKISDMLLYELPEEGEEQYKWMYPGIDMHALIQSRYRGGTIIPILNRKMVLLQN
ncbi:MAG: class I SAM-dependent methyltransferase [Candidatus Paceibacterota bacterium]|jgi:SAM-dependent methyltransferase